MAITDEILSIDRQKVFGDWLITLRMVTTKQIENAFLIQSKTGKSITEVLVTNHIISSAEKDAVLAVQEMIEMSPGLSDLNLDINIIRMIPENFARQYNVIPLSKIGNKLIIAMNNINDIKILDQLEILTGLNICPVDFKPSELSLAVDKFYGAKTSALDAISRAAKDASATGFTTKRIESIDSASYAQDAPVIQVVNSILVDAIDRWATDIHFEPRELNMAVRYRIDGVLHKVMEIPKNIESGVISRLKVLAEMNITEKRKPQDGRFTVDHFGHRFDTRISTIATMWGEKMTIRILRPLTIVRGLESLGFHEDDLKRFRRIINAPSGIILTTGPTSSGKTTTLYAAIGELDKDTENIVTIEDPIEYPIDNINQTQVMSKIGMNFADSLRTILRQDPDVIMIGEIRDGETLKTAMQASLTGHMVLSTIHTNNAVSTITRLIDMGAEPSLISSTITGVIGQRLVRRICPNCIYEYTPNQDELNYLKLPADTDIVLAQGRGCDHCNNTGYKGMIGIFEVLIISRRIKELITTNAPIYTIYESAKQEGMHTLFDDVKYKILNWRTTVKESLRVLGVNLDE